MGSFALMYTCWTNMTYVQVTVFRVDALQNTLKTLAAFFQNVKHQLQDQSFVDSNVHVDVTLYRTISEFKGCTEAAYHDQQTELKVIRDRDHYIVHKQNHLFNQKNKTQQHR